MIDSRQVLLEGTLSHGLEFLHDVFRIKDHVHLALTMQERISYPRISSFSRILEKAQQSMRRARYPSDQDLKQNQRDLLPFQGDNEELPPLAWTLI